MAAICAIHSELTGRKVLSDEVLERMLSKEFGALTAAADNAKTQAA